MEAEMPQSSILSPIFYSYSIYINDPPQTPGVCVGHFADNTSIYGTDHKEVYVLRKLQKDLIATETCYGRWMTNISDDKTESIHSSHRFRPLEALVILKRRNVPFVNHVKYLFVIFDKRITWRLLI
jgi:hypothetical protein